MARVSSARATGRRQRAYNYYFEKGLHTIIHSYTDNAKTGEYNSNNAFIYNGNTGNVNNNNKYNTNAVRPVSEFQGNVDPFASFYKSMRAAYRLCLKNKVHTANAIRFWLDEESELVALAREVFNCEYVPRQSIAFIVTKPCLREVVAADFRDRIVQHYIVMRLEALFEECGTLDDNMFSCRVGKGNLAAIQALQQQIFHQSKGYTADCYVAKFDLQSFFMSIDKRRLYDELVALVAKRYEGWDKDTLLYLIRVVTLHNPQDNAVRKTPLCDWADLPRSKSLYNVDWFLGLAIGNLTSQSDANFYNAPAMRWMRSVGLAPVNYVDDFAFVVRDKASFLTAMPYIRNYFAAERGLTMHPRKFYLQHYSKGIKFLGAVIKYNRVYTNNQTVARCFGKIHYYNEARRHSSRRKARHVEKLATILNSYLGLMRHFDTFNIRKRIAAEVGTVWCDYIRFDDDITTATVVKHFRQREICKYNVRKQRRRDLFTLKTYSTMETQQQINELQSRQLELRAIMASSDERAAKCFKNGTSFRETYPDDFARYEAANTEYNRNEQTLAKLEATRDAERAEEEQAHNIDAV